MQMRRRTATLAALGLLATAGTAIAQTNDEAVAVAHAEDALHNAMLDPDRARLEPLLADPMTYGHSDGVVQNKAQFIDSLVSRKALFKTIVIAGQTIVVTGVNALVRHRFTGDVESNGKIISVKLDILEVWVKEGGDWKLLARQAVGVHGA